MIETVYVKALKTFAFNDHHFYTGQSGSGKSVAAERQLITKVESKNYLGIDLGDRGRFENFCYLLKETNQFMVNRLKYLTMDYEKPRKIKCEPYLICGRSLAYHHKLPACIKLVSFNKEDLGITDMIKILGGTENLFYVLNNFQAKFGDDANLKDVADVLFHNEFRDKKVNFRWGAESVRNMVVNHLRAWDKSGIFSEHKDVIKLDLKKEFNREGDILSFNNFLLLGEEDEIVYNIILKNLFELKRQGFIKPRIALYLRELMNFLSYPLCKQVVSELATQGRGYGIDLVSCFQSPTQVKPPNIRSQAGYYTQMKAHYREAEKLLEIQFVPKEQLLKVPHFNQGECILATGVRWDKNVMIPPTPHRHADPKGFQVIDALGEEYGWREYDAEEILSYKFKEVADVEQQTTKEPRLFKGVT